jgi:hypothetical protein
MNAALRGAGRASSFAIFGLRVGFVRIANVLDLVRRPGTIYESFRAIFSQTSESFALWKWAFFLVEPTFLFRTYSELIPNS